MMKFIINGELDHDQRLILDQISFGSMQIRYLIIEFNRIDL